MAVSPAPDDIVVLADRMDSIEIDAHARRVEAMIAMFEERRGQETRTIGYDPGYPKPRHTTTFGEMPVVVECSQQRDIAQVPQRTVRVFGSQHLYRCEYRETETSDPADVLDPADLDDAIRLAKRFLHMLGRMRPDVERGRAPHPDVMSGLSAFLLDAGMPPPRRDLVLTTGRPYRLPVVKARDANGDYRPVEGVDPATLDLWMPDVASMSERSFGPARVEIPFREVDWGVDPVEMLRMTIRKAQRCSG